MTALLLEAAIRSTLIAAGVGAILAGMRIRQPALRHVAWTGVLGVMLLLPGWIAWGPQAGLRLLPAEPWQGRELTRTAEDECAAPFATASHREAAPARSSKAVWNWQDYTLAIYLAGAGVLLVRLGIGTSRVRRLVRESRVKDGRRTHAACIAPITVGWRRPVVILPEGWTRWPERQLSAILVHEQEHVRRRDPLVQWLALLNRAVFWFHPLAWWLERELSRTAEEACDGAVLRHGHEAREYAAFLLSLARAVASAGTQSKVLGMAAAGAGLGERIRKIVGGEPRRVSQLRVALAAAGCAAAAAGFASGRLVHAQPSSPAFDVASIKVNRSNEQGGSSKFTGNTYTGTNVTLRRVIALAYSPVQEFTGGPGWIESERYDIVAKAEGNPSRQQLQMMLRSLLADRFKLLVHKETRDAPAYALVPARSDGKPGPSLKPSTADCSEAGRKGPGSGGGCGFRLGRGALRGRGATMERLAAELFLVGRLVVDRTGLTGLYDLDVEWTPDDEETNEDLFRALREQLGLKLQPTRAPVEVIVIDSALKPTEN